MSSVLGFGAVADGQTDNTKAIYHAIEDGGGMVQFPRGVFAVDSTIEIDLDAHGPICIDGSGGAAKIINRGSGPVFRFIGTHGGTADPLGFKPNVWRSQRMPTIRDLEIQGTDIHNQADGIEITGTMQCMIEGVALRRLRHGILMVKRNRNVIVSHCQIYHNTGVGIFLNGVNLHQINIVDSHISYNRLGGIRIEDSEIRNLQITGNDIEYNNHRVHKTEPVPTAEIYIDTRSPKATVNEITIASNTIQATVSPGGANIRILESGGQDRPPGLWAISGNIIGSQENNVHLTGCHGVVLSGNFIYSCGNRNVLAENSSQINIGTNNFRRHTSSMGTGIRLTNCVDSIINGCTVRDEHPDGQTSAASPIELDNCTRINITGCQAIDGVPYGIDINDSSIINITGCTVMDSREKRKSKGTIRFTGNGQANLVTSCTVDQPIEAPAQSNVTQRNNLSV